MKLATMDGNLSRSKPGFHGIGYFFFVVKVRNTTLLILYFPADFGGDGELEEQCCLKQLSQYRHFTRNEQIMMSSSIATDMQSSMSRTC